MNRIFNACKVKTNKNNYLKDRTVCKSRYNKNRRKNNNNTIIENEIINSHRQLKIKNVNINKNNRSLIIAFSNCVKTYLMNYTLLRKQEPFFINTKIVKSIR